MAVYVVDNSPDFKLKSEFEQSLLFTLPSLYFRYSHLCQSGKNSDFMRIVGLSYRPDLLPI